MSWANEYPRPQMVRGNYHIISEGWTLNGEPIKVPFPPEAKASEYEASVDGKLTYLVRFDLERLPKGERLLLHFGAVDQVATVFVNSTRVGYHEGGYLPFSCDITEVIKEKDNVLRLEVEDYLDMKYPYGKQSKKPHGMWYTSVSGIWQSVWYEFVPETGVFGLRLHTNCKELRAKVESKAPMLLVTIRDENGETLTRFQTKERKIVVDFENLKLPIHLWSPDNPYLYGLTIQADEDLIESYFALREVEVKEEDGHKRVFLNGEKIFLHGVLDQGYFEEGIYLPLDPKEYDRDVLRMKELGINTLRKHIKVEPERFYFACDKYGMLVMQDMVNSGGYNFFLDTALPNIGFWRRNDRYPWGWKRKRIFERHSLDIVRHVRNHPCIIGYTIFNEGWGQFSADKMYELLKREEPSKLFDSTSGWFIQRKSDFDSRHIYFKNKHLVAKEKPLLLSECGGYTRGIEGHLYNSHSKYGYGDADTMDALMNRIETLYEKMVYPSIEDGLCGCIYTQLSDVETEINGLYTYDRQVCKVDKERMRQIEKRVNGREP